MEDAPRRERIEKDAINDARIAAECADPDNCDCGAVVTDPIDRTIVTDDDYYDALSEDDKETFNDAWSREYQRIRKIQMSASNPKENGMENENGNAVATDPEEKSTEDYCANALTLLVCLMPDVIKDEVRASILQRAFAHGDITDDGIWSAVVCQIEANDH